MLHDKDIERERRQAPRRDDGLAGWARIIARMSGHRAPAEPTTEPVASPVLSDTQALDLIRAEMSGVMWSPDTLEVIAAYVRGTGREILGPDDDEPQFTSDVRDVREESAS